jgi:hypothetical protein
MKVDFILIGAQKSGTTSLAAQLAAHSQISFSKVKEPGYFNATKDWQANLDSYHKLFNPKSGQRCGEASTMYTFFPEWMETHQRLHAYNPKLKLIYIMRQPVDRVISHYTHNLVRNLEKKPPQEAVLSDLRYINRSRYAVQIRPYLELFSQQQVLLLLFEEYIADQLGVLRRIADFLEIDAAGFADMDDLAQHRSVGESYLKHPAVEKVVASEGFQFVRRVIPASIRQPIRYRFFSNRLERKPDFPDQLRSAIWRLTVDDVRAIEEIMGQEIDQWRAEFVN